MNLFKGTRTCLASFSLIALLSQSIFADVPPRPVAPPSPTPSTAPKGVRLFVTGHSFHVWVAPLLAEAAKNAGIVDHTQVGVSSIGGSTVLRHWNESEEKFKVKPALRDGKVDVLTIAPIWLPDEGIENFVTLAVQGNPNIRITVQEYWLPNDEYVPKYPLEVGKRKGMDRNATVLADLRKAQEQYDHDIEEHVKSLNKKLGKEAIFIVPVGRAVVALREKIAAGEVPAIKTQAELFRDSWGHCREPVQALSAYCHFAVIYQRSPVGLPIPAILSQKPGWNNTDLNRLLQELAWEAVSKHPMGGVKG